MIKPNVPQGNIRMLIMLPFLNDKTECSTGKYWEIKIPRFLGLFSRRKTSIKAGSILSFLGSSEMERFAKIANC